MFSYLLFWQLFANYAVMKSQRKHILDYLNCVFSDLKQRCMFLQEAGNALKLDSINVGFQFRNFVSRTQRCATHSSQAEHRWNVTKLLRRFAVRLSIFVLTWCSSCFRWHGLLQLSGALWSLGQWQRRMLFMWHLTFRLILRNPFLNPKPNELLRFFKLGHLTK